MLGALVKCGLEGFFFLGGGGGGGGGGGVSSLHAAVICFQHFSIIIRVFPWLYMYINIYRVSIRHML